MRNVDFYTGRTGNRLFQLAYMYAQVRGGRIPDWYVQDYRHFDLYLGELRDMLSEGITSLPYVAIHFRVGANPSNTSEPKYNDNPFYVNLAKTKYYQDAMEHFPNARFLVFSDDTYEARAFFKQPDMTFYTDTDEIGSLNAMASCEGIITANSSFSYWAALLGNPNKKVVAPTLKNWYKDGKERTVCPPHWIRI